MLDEAGYAATPHAPPDTQAQTTSKPKFKRLSEVEPRKQEHLFDPYLLRGTLNLIAGFGGAGKTYLSQYLIKITTTGGDFITDNPFIKRQPENVIYLSKENDESTVTRPRLERMGADLNRVILPVDDGIPFTLNDTRLEDIVKQTRPAMMVFDPVQSFLGDNVDMHRANQVRPVLDSLIDLAKRYNVAVVLICHLNKMSAASAVDRINGSVDFRDAARSVIICGKDPENQEQRIFAHAKYNGGEYGKSVAYHTLLST